jgi:hypothetical protein
VVFSEDPAGVHTNFHSEVRPHNNNDIAEVIQEVSETEEK